MKLKEELAEDMTVRLLPELGNERFVVTRKNSVLLMDQDLLRRDEMWIAERNAEEVCALLSFGEYKDVRYDKDIRKSYLQGRLGGIPRILLQFSIENHI